MRSGGAGDVESTESTPSLKHAIVKNLPLENKKTATQIAMVNLIDKHSNQG
jgi:hypothetical protein